ncbi:uncharacterized protein Z520_11272 [Fonsecaea multimorphosa CBS 102226]|uniref:AB hydrolase-1 domain-containing protein n=1 Tax=Fonsecaea multimorphosa CBS 102226 TaxID=1442371 RepID=A0A0D2JRB5_9EURO|nr:uncharacterized protein Z520_11272 [Fonsecaea multimorphosa CBS 102226]KIX92999.1 hypothetical protein Z520_11272 [Fonsecaea multimorphosa CBS 102226]OAL18247.1 hypothetical protein AYO22_10825 [Fonsecaea multimorphosa]
MSAFSILLPDGSAITGKDFSPSESRVPVRARPLLVLIPGGTYTVDFFDADEKHTVRTWATALGVPVVGLNRPGYGDVPVPTAMDKDGSTFIQQSGRWLHNVGLPTIWEKFAQKYEFSSIVLYGHSIGGAVAIVAASLYEEGASPYKLSGLSMAGIGCDTVYHDFLAIFDDMHRTAEVGPATPIRFPKQQQEQSMLGPVPDLYDPAILEQTERLANPIYLQELYDVEFLWPVYWARYAQSVSVPVLYNMGEHDQLWQVNDDSMRRFGAGFVKAPAVTTTISKHCLHCVEFSHQSPGYYIRLLGFAVECAIQRDLRQLLERKV